MVNEPTVTLIRVLGFTPNAKPKRHAVSLWKLGYRETE